MKKTFIIPLTLGLIICLATGVTVAAFGYANRSQDQAPKYEVNEYGHTYGSGADAISVETEPDLILAIGINGTEGYVKKTELYDDTVVSPEEAVIYMNSGNAHKVRVIPLFKSDGTTVIDQFKIN